MHYLEKVTKSPKPSRNEPRVLKHIHFLARINIKKSPDLNDSNQTIKIDTKSLPVLSSTEQKLMGHHIIPSNVYLIITCSEFKKEFKRFMA